MACNNTVSRPGNNFTGNVTGTFTPQGLSTGGKITEVTIDDTAWFAMPPTPLADRNTLSIINQSASIIKVQHDNTVGYIGPEVLDGGGERSYPIKDTVIVYCRAEPGAGSITVLTEELA